LYLLTFATQDLSQWLVAEYVIKFLIADLAAFLAKEGLWKNKAIWESAKSVQYGVWWKGLCSGMALTSVACRVLSLPATSASAECNWSTYKHIHSTKRN